VTSEVERIRIAYDRRDDLGRYDLSAVDLQALDAHRRRVWSQAVRATQVASALEIGCGAGVALGWMSALGVTTRVGTDLIHQRLVDAELVTPGVLRIEADGRSLPVPDAWFDAVVCSTLFSSILDEQVAVAVAAEARRVLRPGGVVLWFDMRRDNPRNPDVRAVREDDLRRWFPDWELDLASAVLLPPLARRLARWPRLISLLECVPPLRSHLVGVLRPPT
jgi:ubiquinone/menaquinone biosynthesis C-methylase UbiE